MKNYVFRCTKDGNRIIGSHTNATQGAAACGSPGSCSTVTAFDDGVDVEVWVDSPGHRPDRHAVLDQKQFVDDNMLIADENTAARTDGTQGTMVAGSPASCSTATAFEDEFYVDSVEAETAEIACATDRIWIESLGLRQSDRNTLLDHNKCLNDKILNAAQKVLHAQFPNCSGLEDTIKVAFGLVHLKDSCRNVVVQILHDPTKEHWITVSNKSNSDGHISVYCSLQLRPSPKCIAHVLNFLKLSTPSVTVRVMNTRKQEGCVDCGLFVVAYCETILSGKDPCNFIYDQSKMRDHLVSSLEKGYICPFPLASFRTVRRQIVSKYTLNIFCVCRSIHVAGQTMVCCDSCKEWFHQTCLDVCDEEFQMLSNKNKRFLCVQCGDTDAKSCAIEDACRNEDIMQMCDVWYDDVTNGCVILCVSAAIVFKRDPSSSRAARHVGEISPAHGV